MVVSSLKPEMHCDNKFIRRISIDCRAPNNGFTATMWPTKDDIDRVNVMLVTVGSSRPHSFALVEHHRRFSSLDAK